MIGRIPKEMIMASPNRHRYFNKDHSLKRVNNLFKKSLRKRLSQELRLENDSIEKIIAFLSCFLKVNPLKRVAIGKMLVHSFMDDAKKQVSYMNEKQWAQFCTKQVNLSLSFSQQVDYNSSSELCNGDEEDNLEKDYEFKFSEIVKRKQDLFFNPGSFGFDVLKRFCERDFLNPDVPIGYNRGIRIEYLDNEEFYTQFKDLYYKKEEENEK